MMSPTGDRGYAAAPGEPLPGHPAGRGAPAVRRRLSLPRVLLALVGVTLVGASGYAAALYELHHPAAGAASGPVMPTWFAPYVDVTASPTYSFQDPGFDMARQVVLGFVVADPSSSCSPSWGGTYAPSEAAAALDLDRRIVQYRERGDAVIISFGGAAGHELAQTCTDTSSLVAAYASIEARYHPVAFEVDIEGTDLTDAGASARRAAALALLQTRLRTAGVDLPVWLTLPATPAGLSGAAVGQVESMLSAHVELAGVNVLAMDFGSTGHPVADMLVSVESCLDAVHAQLGTLYDRPGTSLDSDHLWNRLGVTVMIGQDDVIGERLPVSQAAALAAFASRQHLARVSMWSLNRDNQCGSYYAEVGVLSDTCSGVAQAPLAFSAAFSGLGGSALASTSTGAAVPLPPLVPDGTRTAPYPIWASGQAYGAGYKVVWHGSVYQAKWSTNGFAPDTTVRAEYETPWLLIGPVLPGDRARTPTTLPAGTFPAWSPTTAYRQGAKVLLDGLPYQAKWWTKGTPPNAYPSDPGASPWQPLFTTPGEPPAA
jgi:chitinase